CRLSLRRLKLKTGHAFCFDVDLFRHVVLQPKGGMKARIRRQGHLHKAYVIFDALGVRNISPQRALKVTHQ
ncbi:hypothetical protein LZ641_01135, partial [Hafnia paralvei]|uniref:hypothetical protein n=1 Tax=Hafnia paralvei TaxID=546367 RepID=UPI001F1CA867